MSRYLLSLILIMTLSAGNVLAIEVYDIIMTTAVNSFKPLASHLDRVQFCLFDDVAFKLFDDAVLKL